MYYWVLFESGRRGTLEAPDSVKAAEKAAAMGPVKSIDRLPYAAKPYLENIGAPAFCWNPEECKGNDLLDATG